MARHRRWTPALLLAGLLLPLLALLPGARPAPASAAPDVPVQPLLAYRGAADPTVVQVGSTWVALSTGRYVPRATAPSAAGPWTDIGGALLTLPRWATGDGIWASDLVQGAGGWVLYFSAPVGGLGPGGRCIGTATATTPLDAFTPDERPLVCPRGAAAPPAYDRVDRERPGLPRGGVIDPEGWTGPDGRRWVLYRTQGQPSSIRIVKVPAGGTAPTGRRQSVELLRNRKVVENPVLLQRGDRIVMLTSQGDFARCRYHTTWRKARTIEKLATARRRTLLDATRTGLCGPGGADLAPGTGDSLLVLHAWWCTEIAATCPAGPNYDRFPKLGATRAMFAAGLTWSPQGVPSVSSWVAPPAPPATPTPVPVPTPTPTVAPTGTPTGLPTVLPTDLPTDLP